MIIKNDDEEFIQDCMELNDVINLETDRQQVIFICLMMSNKLNIMLSNNEIPVPKTFHDTIELCLENKLINEVEGKNINALRRLRNRFTHVLNVRNFEDIETINYKNFYFFGYKDMPKRDIFRASVLFLLLIDTKRKKNYFENKENVDIFKKAKEKSEKGITLLFMLHKNDEIKEFIDSIINSFFEIAKNTNFNKLIDK
jgi:hypothetical protein